MILRLVVILLVIYPASGWAVAYTSSKAGVVSDAATWGGAGVPGDGDTVTVNHAIVFDTNTTIGINGTAANHLTVQGSGSIELAAGVKLTVRGYLYQNNGNAITLQPGASIGLNSTAASRIHLNAAGSRIVANGTVIAPCAITKDGAGIAYITGGSTQGGIQGDYINFNGLRDTANSNYSIFNKSTAANGGIDINHAVFDGCGPILANAAADGNWEFKNITTKNSPDRDIFGSTTSGISTATTGTRVFTHNVLDKFFLMGNARMENFVIEDNIFKERVLLGHGKLASFRNNLVFVSKAAYPTFGYLASVLSDGIHSDNYFIAHTDFSNPHFVSFEATFAQHVDSEWTGNIFEARHATDATGDGILNNPSAQRNTYKLNITAKKNLVLPTPGGYASATPLTIAKFAKGVTAQVENNTYHVGGALGENARGVVIERGAVNGFGGQDIITTFRNNIAWDSVPGRGYKLVNIPDTTGGNVDSGTATEGDVTTLTASAKSWAANVFTTSGGAGTYKVRLTSGANTGSVGTVASNTGTVITVNAWSAGNPANGDTFKVFCVDPVRPSGVAKNLGWNTAAGELYDIIGAKVGTGQGNGYHQYVGESAIGVDDLSVNPGFIDSTRNAASYDLAQGGPGTVDHLLSELSKINDADYNPSYSCAAMMSFVKGGFTPTNPTLKTAGYGGTYVGAMDVVSLGNPAALMMVQ